MMPDLAFTHVALFVSDLDASIEFYRRYAAMKVVHQRTEKSGGRTAWLGDGKLPFVLVLISESRRPLRRAILAVLSRYLPPAMHVGIACESSQEVDELCELGRREGRLRKPPRDAGPVVDYYGIVADPDGFDVEFSYGQVIGPDFMGGRSGGATGN